jgi:hypothetical protein
MRTTPEESVDDPYEETAMKSTSQSTSIFRIRSARKKTAPFRTPIRSTSLPA